MISFRTGNIIAIAIALLAFYGNLTGLTPQNLVNGFISRTNRASRDVSEWVEDTLPSSAIRPESTPTGEPLTPSPPSSRLKRHGRKPESRPRPER